ncbi:MAG: UDP-2,3-diacylglucosamine diphosphatase [Polycyclovorans sp.]|jgi:UDP-2,3-diacylglucosamine hydrolase|nr:UDP-2,3-diacylglucosamine diphosphatase [Gammaproteobacteria bacterium]|tara:strand:+ start:5292 stop:6014 length:723 start_codon:yes stop_codon:yes gene_type:complete
MTAWLVSDLHLPPKPSPLREGFLRWLAAAAQDARQVILLGDIFEAWVGDDLGIETYAEEMAALRRLSAAGIDLRFMVGNRDFLLGDGFCAATGARPLPDPCIVTLGGRPTLLSHGDQWCRDDAGYQRYRRVVHHAGVQRLFLRLPRALRQRIADRLRRQSRAVTATKPVTITDVSPQAIIEAFGHAGVDRIIHGHTHRPAVHHLTVDGRACERQVLPDWTPARMEGLRIAADGQRTPAPA